MNRREFQLSLMTAAALGTLGVVWSPSASTHVAIDPQSQRSYRYRLRYQRHGRTFSIWLRIADQHQFDSDVPVALSFTKDPGGLVTMAKTELVVRALDSHIARTRVVVGNPAWVPGTPIYCSLAIRGNQSPIQTWRFAPA